MNREIIGDRLSVSLRLRSWEPDDLASLLKYANNPAVSGALRDGFPYPYTEADGRSFLEMAAAPRDDALLRAIEIDGEAAGGIGVFRLSDVYRCRAEIGYWLGEPFWGSGIMTAVLGAVIPTAFETFPVTRLEAGIFSSNPASMRVLEKNGFVCEGVSRNAILKRGELLDEHRYVLFRDRIPGSSAGPEK